MSLKNHGIIHLSYLTGKLDDAPKKLPILNKIGAKKKAEMTSLHNIRIVDWINDLNICLISVWTSFQRHSLSWYLIYYSITTSSMTLWRILMLLFSMLILVSGNIRKLVASTHFYNRKTPTLQDLVQCVFCVKWSCYLRRSCSGPKWLLCASLIYHINPNGTKPTNKSVCLWLFPPMKLCTSDDLKAKLKICLSTYHWHELTFKPADCHCGNMLLLFCTSRHVVAPTQFIHLVLQLEIYHCMS